MLPIDFPERNRILHGPRDENGKSTTEILDLPTFTNKEVCISCWQLSEEEKLTLHDTNCIWVWLWAEHIDKINLSTLCPINRGNVAINVVPISMQILYKFNMHSITVWKFTDEEVELIQSTGCFWFTIQSGYTQPPVGFTTFSPSIEN